MPRNQDSLSYDRVCEVLDYNQISGVFTWHVARNGGRIKKHSVAGTVNQYGYISITIDNNWYLAHRLAYFWMNGEWPDHQMDHIDGDRKNNRWDNLREATNLLNSGNRKIRKGNGTGFKGVWRNGGKYWARIMMAGKLRVIGRFDTPEEAHRAYCAEAVKQFGEFARAG